MFRREIDSRAVPPPGFQAVGAQKKLQAEACLRQIYTAIHLYNLHTAMP